MPTGSGTCEDALAAANALLERATQQYLAANDELYLLRRELWELQGSLSAGRSVTAPGASAGLGQLAQAVRQLEGGGRGGQVIVETMPEGTDPIALLMRRAAGLRERIDRLEAEA